MELTAEEKITKILSSSESLRINKDFSLVSEPKYNLGEYLISCKSQPSPYGDKYLFIK